jgi:hypothetical protein
MTEIINLEAKNASTVVDIDSLVDDLHTIQRFLLAHPDLEVGYVAGRTAYLAKPYVEDEDGVTNYDELDTAALAQIIRTMKDGGPVEKRASDGYMTYVRKLGNSARLELNVERNKVCEAKVVGQETVIHQPVPYQPGREEKRDIIEWVCAPILAQAEED